MFEPPSASNSATSPPISEGAGALAPGPTLRTPPAGLTNTQSGPSGASSASMTRVASPSPRLVAELLGDVSLDEAWRTLVPAAVS